MFNKIISGGQIGAEQAALDVAINLNIPHGGWIQKGRKTESWTLPDKYRLEEMSTASFKKRIEKNVMESDGTVIISHGELTGGADYSREMAEKHNRPCLYINLHKTPEFIAATKINTWAMENNIQVLNVTGQRASEDYKIYAATMDIIETAYYLGHVEDRSFSVDPPYAASLWDRKPDTPTSPHTVDEVVDTLISELTLKDKAAMAKMTAEETASLNQTLGRYIRDAFGLWTGNKELMASCRLAADKKVLNEDAASMVIIKELWGRLKGTYKLRIVK